MQFEVLQDPSIFLRALPVNYTREFPIANYFDDESMRDAKRFLSKFEHWSYEKEHRIVALDGAHQWLRFKSQALRGIILGANCPASVQVVLSDLLSERRDLGLPVPNLFACRQHSREYRVTIHRAAGHEVS